MTMWQERFGEFITLFLVIDPISVVPAFVMLVGGMKPKDQRRIALRAVVVAFAVMAFFIFAGSFLLEHLKIPLGAFQIAGGIVLFVVALEMVRGESHPIAKGKDGHMNLAIYPLAIPKIAGPGPLLAVLLVSDDDRYNIAGQFGTVGSLAAVMLIQLALLLAAGPVFRVIGMSVANVIARVMGLLLAALAVSLVLAAIGQWLKLPAL